MMMRTIVLLTILVASQAAVSTMAELKKADKKAKALLQHVHDEDNRETDESSEEAAASEAGEDESDDSTAMDENDEEERDSANEEAGAEEEESQDAVDEDSASEDQSLTQVSRSRDDDDSAEATEESSETDESSEEAAASDEGEDKSDDSTAMDENDEEERDSANEEEGAEEEESQDAVDEDSASEEPAASEEQSLDGVGDEDEEEQSLVEMASSWKPEPCGELAPGVPCTHLYEHPQGSTVVMPCPVDQQTNPEACGALFGNKADGEQCSQITCPKALGVTMKLICGGGCCPSCWAPDHVIKLDRHTSIDDAAVVDPAPQAASTCGGVKCFKTACAAGFTEGFVNGDCCYSCVPGR